MNMAAALATLISAVVVVSACSGDGSATPPDPSGDNALFFRPSTVLTQSLAGNGPIGQVVRVLNEDDTITSCTFATDGKLDTCHRQGNDEVDRVYGLAFNPRTGTAYVLQDRNTDSVLGCEIDTQGSLGICVANRGNGTIVDPRSVAISASADFAYVVNANDTVSVCSLDGKGAFQQCTSTTAGGALLHPTSVSLLTTASGSYAYFLNGITDNVITACALGPGGLPTACTAQDGGGTFHGPNSISFDARGAFAYVSNFETHTVSICGIAGTTGLLTACQETDGQGAFNGIQQIAFDASGKNAYVLNAGDSSIAHCKLASGGSAFSACTPYRFYGFQFTPRFALAVHGTSQWMYVSSIENHSVYSCRLDTDGAFSECIQQK